LLEDLGRAHDIGKITGTARPERSLEVLRRCGVDDPALLALVKWHDTSLPWYRSHGRGEGPSEKAWRRLATEVCADLLAIFSVADREDAPGGWRRNRPTSWFIDTARARGLIGDLTLDVPGVPSEISAGTAVVDDGRVLLLAMRGTHELPKGGIEWDELPEEAALRETREETGLSGPIAIGCELGHVDYEIGPPPHTKRVRYFFARAAARVPEDSRHRWVARNELDRVELVNPGLRTVLERALDLDAL
jgi:ADP-ribose pyrophosphatase YjhB (NUDIX family)